MKLRILEFNKKLIFYRSLFVPKGTCGSTCGCWIRQFFGCLPAAAQELPMSLLMKLSLTELAYLVTFCLQREAHSAH